MSETVLTEISKESNIFSEKEIEKYTKTGDFYIGRGGTFTGSPYLRRKGDIVVPEHILKAHILTLGATRSGKTVLLKLIASQAIRKGWGLMLVDFKPDSDLYQSVYYETLLSGRENDYIFFSPNLAAIRSGAGNMFPSSSATYNPMISGSQEEIVSRVSRSISDFDKNAGGDKFWKDIEEDAIDGSVGALAGMDKIFSYRDMWTLISSPAAQKYVIDNTKNIQSRAKLIEMYNFFQKSADTAKKYYKGTQIALGSYALGEVSPYLNSYQPSINLYEVVTKQKILHVALSNQLSEKTASGTAKLLISDINSVVGRVLTTQGKLNTRFLIIIDEFENAIFKGINDLFNKSAGAGVTMIVGHQSLADIDLRAGVQMRNIILDNTQTKICMLQTGTEGAKLLSEVAGKTHRNKSKIMEFSVFNPFVFFERNIKNEETNLLEPCYLTNLEPLNFYAKIGDRVHRGIVPIIPTVSDEVKKLPQYSYDIGRENNSAGLNLFETFYSDIRDSVEEAPHKRYGK